MDKTDTILYLDLGMGAAGDMLMGALLELHPDPAGFLERLRGLGLPGVEITAEKASTCGISGTHMRVLVHGQEEHSEDVHEHTHGDAQDHAHTHTHGDAHDHEHTHTHDHGHTHHHASLHDITHIIQHLDLPRAVKDDALAVYDSIAQAESRAHGVDVTEIHFHEVGTLDAVADVVGVCLLFHELGAAEIAASPVHVGSGSVRCAHGIMPVPAPATAYLLEGIPSYGGEIRGELCTPTGAALLRHFVGRFGPQEIMCVERIGYGVGSKEFPRANCVRAMLGTRVLETERVQVNILSCNIDDMTPEDLACGMEVLRDAGALEVYTVAANMKKGRPGVVLSCVCHSGEREKLAELMFRHFTTLGIRVETVDRYELSRSITTLDTAYGPVRKKTAWGYGVRREKLELEDLKAIAEKTGKSLEELRRELGKRSYDV